MTTDLERAARAIYEQCFQYRDAPLTGAPWDALTETARNGYRDMARAALTAPAEDGVGAWTLDGRRVCDLLRGYGRGDAYDAFLRIKRGDFDATPPASAAVGVVPNESFRDIWQHDETGRIVELPLGSAPPGPRYVLVATTNAPQHYANPDPADAGAACCQASRRAALEEAEKACEALCVGMYPHARTSYVKCAAAIRTLAQGGAA